MLKFFNRLEKTRNFFILGFAILMVISLVFWNRNSIGNGGNVNLAQSTQTAATVSGEKITVGEIVRQQENYSQFGRGQTIPAKMIIEGMIGSRVARVEADRLGLTASDAEVAAAVRDQLKQPDGTTMAQATYEQNATERAGSISAYEQSVRDDLSYKKLDAYITSGVTVSEEELLNDFQRKNTKFDLSYVSVSATDLAKTITPSDADLHDYFDKNKASYYISVPQKKIRYIFVDMSKIGAKLQITDADIKAEYDKLAPDKKLAGVNGQEIVLRVSRPEFEQQVQSKANDLVTQLRKDGPIVSEDAFADLAKGQSENAATAQNGGKLAGPVRENVSKPDDPYQQLLKMKPGEVTEPISYQGRYFILRRGEDVPKTYDQAKKEIEASLRNRRSYTVAAELAQKISDALKQSKDPQKTAAEFAAQASMSVADMIKETGYLKPGDDVPNIGISAQFEEGIAPLETVGDVGDKTPIQNGFAIPMLADRKEPRDAEFDEVKAQLVEAVKLDKARTQVEEIAKAIASGAPNAAGLAAAATAKGMTAKDKTSYILGSPLGEGPNGGSSEALEDAIYALKAGDVTKTPILVGDNWYIVGASTKTDANMADFAKQRSSLLEQKLSAKRADVFSDYLAAVRQKLESNGSIKIYKDVLTLIDGQNATEPELPEDTQN